MQRTSQLFIRLSDEERARIERLAKSVRLAPSTAARVILLDMADAVEEKNAELQKIETSN